MSLLSVSYHNFHILISRILPAVHIDPYLIGLYLLIIIILRESKCPCTSAPVFRIAHIEEILVIRNGIERHEYTVSFIVLLLVKNPPALEIPPYPVLESKFFPSLSPDYIPVRLRRRQIASQKSAWAVMASLGLFQMDGGTSTEPVYEIASPLFEEVVIDLGGRYGRGQKFTIKANGASRKNMYVQSAVLNGKELNSFRFPASELLKGGELVLEMGPEPNYNWGR